MKKKQEEDVSTMFLVPKRIYLAVRGVISEDDKLNQLDQLNKGTNYIEDAIQFKQQKSYKTQPEDLKKTVSTLVNTFNNIEQPAQIEINSLPAQNSEEDLPFCPPRFPFCIFPSTPSLLHFFFCIFPSL